ncbi:MAG TPA: hypothetical protein PK127_02705 [Clostridiales bacterium]|nr:hypothetical protein [Clostridiales bacterium]HPV01378.1 hypothetical protein [Clostridiales bacterium]
MDDMVRAGKQGRTLPKAGMMMCTAAGWAAALASLVSYPYVFGAAAIILGIRISKGGSRAGLPLVAASILLMAAGLIFSDMLHEYLKNIIGV